MTQSFQRKMADTHVCEGYYGTDTRFVESFTCPLDPDSPMRIFCCGFEDVKYCCSEPGELLPLQARVPVDPEYRSAGWTGYHGPHSFGLGHQCLRSVCPVFLQETTAAAPFRTQVANRSLDGSTKKALKGNVMQNGTTSQNSPDREDPSIRVGERIQESETTIVIPVGFQI
ncbi:hypothetical protein SKAU_G00361960 [Synaphobranchus kaupii]|uniref:Shisa N-terminal domain-containing protein n=1 Tax=Synaphobranchus kaupii TaxID=118154 RepID=A0A9Q1EIJ2_SYNKA|nr:hypothetical protein SKAU_G00361960 [Synaphobranchus kaupii]